MRSESWRISACSCPLRWREVCEGRTRPPPPFGLVMGWPLKEAEGGDDPAITVNPAGPALGNLVWNGANTQRRPWRRCWKETSSGCLACLQKNDPPCFGLQGGRCWLVGGDSPRPWHLLDSLYQAPCICESGVRYGWLGHANKADEVKTGVTGAASPICLEDMAFNKNEQKPRYVLRY